MRSRWVALTALVVLVAAGCGNSTSSSGGSGGETQGITNTEIKIGSLAAITGPLGNQYAPVADGVESYIDMINAQGGVDGRKIDMVAKLDDATNPSRDISQAQALNEQYKVFAVVGVATPLFPAGTYFGQNNVPTFGWNVNQEWQTYPSLFGEKGSYLDFSASPMPLPYLASKLHLTKLGVLAYNVSQSQQCATQTADSIKKYGLDLVFEDSSLPFGTTNIDADLQRMKQSGVQLMGTCMDPTGNVLLARGLQEAGLHVTQYWPNGYDQDTLDTYKQLMDGVYFAEGFVPFEAASASPGTTQFLQQLHLHFPQDKPSEVEQAGWINAELFVDGLKAVGHDLTRSKLIAAINAMHAFTANGIWPAQSPIDWQYAHTTRTPNQPDCTSFMQVQNGKFVPVFGTPTDPFVCLDHNATSLPH
jgi:ABC-type branched-subunit amino acid transport system substrate-binding protein